MNLTDGRNQTSGSAEYGASDGYMSLKTLTEYSGMSIRTLRNWISHPVRPLPHYRIGGKLLVRRSEYDSWAKGFRCSIAFFG